MDSKPSILLFGGTTEGRALCEALSRAGREATVCTATAYGEEALGELPHIRIRTGRMDADAMAALIVSGGFDLVLDATHPYAAEASRAIRQACERTGCARIRVARRETDLLPSDTTAGNTGCGGQTDTASPPREPRARITRVPDTDAAAAYLAGTRGTIFLATGSKDLARFCAIPDYRERLYVRVLPDADAIRACTALGFHGSRIIAMQGPFSHELNLAMLRQFRCAFLVSKSTGREGGLDAKASAAREAGAELVLVERPEDEHGLLVDEVLVRLGLVPDATEGIWHA